MFAIKETLKLKVTKLKYLFILHFVLNIINNTLSNFIICYRKEIEINTQIKSRNATYYHCIIRNKHYPIISCLKSHFSMTMHNMFYFKSLMIQRK